MTLYASPEARQAVGIDTYHPDAPVPAWAEAAAGAGRRVGDRRARRRADVGDRARGQRQRLPRATAVELSPNALNIAVGRGRDLVAVHTNGSGERVLRRTEGQVVAISWAPNPIEIAYVVKTGTHYRLHLIEGDGDNDRLIDPSVSPARPTWRWDNGELAYVSSNGHVVVRDLIHARSTVLAARLPASGHTAGVRTGGEYAGRRRQRQRRGGYGARSGWLSIACDDAHPRPSTSRARAARGSPRPPSSRSAVATWRSSGPTARGCSCPPPHRVTWEPGRPRRAAGNRLVVALAGHRLRMIEVDANTLHIRRVLLDAPAGGRARRRISLR